MENTNPQNKDLVISKKFAIAQDTFGVLAFILAIIQSLISILPPKVFLILTGVILIAEYMSSYLQGIYFDKGHRIREMGLLDNSFNEKRIPNYNSGLYYNNESVLNEYIKLLANIHENALFTLNIAGKMSIKYYVISIVALFFFLVKLFISGMDDYSSILLTFIVSSSFFDRAVKINSLKKSSEEIYDKANAICSSYEKNPNEANIFLPKILELVLMYENAIFETKIVLNEKIFTKLNSFLSKEWQDVRNNYLIYNDKKETEK